MNKKCTHPINKVHEVGKDGKELWICNCGAVMDAARDFNPATMTRATDDDIQRIWRQLWGDEPTLLCRIHWQRENGELLDLTQTATA